MPFEVGPVDPNKVVDINFVAFDSHGYAYRLWWRDPNTEWTEIGEGGTATGAVNHYQHAVAHNSQLAYIINVGTVDKQPTNAPYAAMFTIAQSGKIFPNGSIPVAGTTNASGNATQDDWVNFT